MHRKFLSRLNFKTRPRAIPEQKEAPAISAEKEDVVIPEQKEAPPKPAEKEGATIPERKEAPPIPAEKEGAAIPEREEAPAILAEKEGAAIPEQKEALAIPAEKEGAAIAAQKEKRVVLVGVTGHGKGALGNFLFNLGMPRKDGTLVFEESDPLKLVPDTQKSYCHNLEIENSPNAEGDRKSMRFIILDTPGLNDIGRETDLWHMIDIFEMIEKQFRSLNMLVLVYRSKIKFEATIGPALRYYRDLFAPLFRAQNVILVVTFVSSEDYEIAVDKKNWDSIIQAHLDACNEALELKTSAWNCPIVKCYFVNSKWTPTKIGELLRQIKAERVIDQQGLLYRSYLMREQILDCISQAGEIPLKTYRMSLPPLLETERSSVVSLINGRINELLKAVHVEDKYKGEQLSQINQLREELTNKRNNIEKCETEIHKLSAIQKTFSVRVAGDDIIKILNAGVYSVEAPCDKTSSCGGCIMNYKYENHNAMHSNNYPKTEGRTLKVQVNPDLINVRKKENRYWFYRFWLEYDGKSHNKTQIEWEQKLLADFEEERRHIEQKLDTTDKQLKDAEKKLAEHYANLKKLHEDRSLLQPTEFDISKVPDVLKCMESNRKIEQLELLPRLKADHRK